MRRRRRVFALQNAQRGPGRLHSDVVRMYAQRKGWLLESVRVVLVHGKVHASDCADCETREARIDRIARVIELNGELDESQRKRLLEITDMCPVHRTLHAEVDILTRAGEP